MKKHIFLAAIVFFLMLFVFVLLAERNQEVKRSEELLLEADKEIYKDQIEREMVRETKENQKRYFMGGCMKEGNYEYCECFYDTLKDKYGADAINDMSAEILSGDFSDNSWDKMMETASGCIKHYE